MAFSIPNFSSLARQAGISRSSQRALTGFHNAGDWTTVEVQGLKELEAALNELPEKTARKVLTSAVRDGAELIRAQAALRAPHDPSVTFGKPSWRKMFLKDGIKKSISIKSLGVAGAIVRAKIGLDKKHAFFGRYIEKGWVPAGRMHIAPRATKHLRKITGDLSAIAMTRRNSRAKDAVATTTKVKAQPFMRPAFEAMKMKALELVKTRLRAGIDRIARESFRKAT